MSFWPGERCAIPIEYQSRAPFARKKLAPLAYTQYRCCVKSQKTKNWKTKRRTSSRELELMMRDYVEGKKSVVEIANNYGITPGALTMRAKKLGLPLRGRGRWRLKSPTALQKEIIAVAEKESCQQTAKKFGISKQRVSQIVRRWTNKSPSRETYGGQAQQATPPGPRHTKVHVISFRVDDQVFARLSRELQRSLFNDLDSPSEVARELLMIFLARMPSA